MVLAEEMFVQGENPDVDLRDPYAKKVNKELISYGDNPNIVVPLGGELGDVPAKDVRVWRSDIPGKLIVFIRKETGEHKVIAPIVALGVVATALGGIKYLKK